MKIIKAILLALVLSITPLFVFAEPVNINKANATVMAKNIKGVGPKLAGKIIAYRKQHGPFKTVDELKKVKGVGDKLIEKNRKQLTVGSLK